jgi:hypothetical protein
MNRLMHGCLIGALLLCGCSSLAPLTGTSEQGNARVTGAVIFSNGEPAARVQVSLIAAAYNPVTDGPVSRSRIDTTDVRGSFTFTNVDTGAYVVSAVQIDMRTRALKTGILVKGDTAVVPVAMLREPGAIKVLLPEGFDAANGYVYVPGTTISGVFTDNNSAAVLDSVPSGIIPQFYLGARNDPTQQRRLRDSIRVQPNSVTVVANAEWKYSMKFSLNTTPSGAGVAGVVYNFPVLVRLTERNIDFSRASDKGLDIRFSKPDGTPLSYEIETWDAAARAAAVWVKIDTLFGNDSSHAFFMYYGNENASGASSSITVFDTAAGFQGVWHLGQPGGATALDATANHYDGAPFNMAASAQVSGAIGEAQRFDGRSTFFQMRGTADSKLNFPRSGTYAISAWVNADTLDRSFRTIASKGDYQYNLEIVPTDEWQFAEYGDGKGWDMTTMHGQEKTWTYLTGVRSGDKEYLYVNGTLVDATIFLNISTLQRYTGFDFMIGRNRDPANDSTGFFFKGIIDEVRISSVV